MCVSVDVEKRAQLYQLSSQQLKQAKNGYASAPGKKNYFKKISMQLSISLANGLISFEGSFLFLSAPCRLSCSFSMVCVESLLTRVLNNQQLLMEEFHIDGEALLLRCTVPGTCMS